MKASEIIAVLAKGIEKYGDKPVLINTNSDVYYEPTFYKPGLFWFKKDCPKNGKNAKYMYFDVDLT